MMPVRGSLHVFGHVVKPHVESTSKCFHMFLNSHAQKTPKNKYESTKKEGDYFNFPEHPLGSTYVLGNQNFNKIQEKIRAQQQQLWEHQAIPQL